MPVTVRLTDTGRRIAAFTLMAALIWCQAESLVLCVGSAVLS